MFRGAEVLFTKKISRFISMLFIRIDPLKETRSKKSKKRSFFSAQSELHINGTYYAFQHAAQPTIVKGAQA